MAGNCRWASDCAGNSVTGQCPGPGDFKCCQSPESGCGGYSEPSDSFEGGCEQVAISGARAIIAEFPGRVRQVGCKRPPGDRPSDHYNGTATDIMCSDALNKATVCGQEIAEWIRDNRASLNLKYVIWGQRIWSPARDAVKPWAEWRSQPDLGSITLNHWVSPPVRVSTETTRLSMLYANAHHRTMSMSAITAKQRCSQPLRQHLCRPQSDDCARSALSECLCPPARSECEVALLYY